MNAPFKVEAVKRYRTPRSPRFGYVIPPRKNRNFWSALPVDKLVIAAAAGGVASLSLAGCGLYPMGGAIPSEYYGNCVDIRLSEEEARTILHEAFTARGFEISADFEFSRDAVSFTADGYDPEQAVGYDYQTEEEALADFEEPAERQQIEDWNQKDGPYFLILEERVSCYWEGQQDESIERDRLVAELGEDIEDFLEQVEAQGTL